MIKSWIQEALESENWQAISQILTKASYKDIAETVCHMLDIPYGVLSEGTPIGPYYACWDNAIVFGKQDVDMLNLVHLWFIHDPISVKVFTNLMAYRICPNIKYIKNAYDADNPQYYDPSIIHLTEDEVFVDCGAYNGDSVLSFIKAANGKYSRIYVYEPAVRNALLAAHLLENYKNVVVFNRGVSDRLEELVLREDGASSTFMISSQNETGPSIETSTIDNDILEPVTFIKMDVEGFELRALMGAAKHIKANLPKLAICVYHRLGDIWKVPSLIYCIDNRYKFYLRHYDQHHNWETVLYAIPCTEEG